MKRAAMIAGLLTVAVVAPLRGQDDCVTDKRCPDGSKPPACCAPPPCEIHEALMRAHAGRRMYKVHAAETLQKIYGDSSKARSEYLDYVSDFGSFKNCKDAQHPQARRLDVDSDCNIGLTVTANGDSGEFRQLTKDDYEREMDTCTELTDAAWERALVEQTFCVATDEAERASLVGQITQGAAAFDKEIEVLEGYLESFWGACSTPSSIFKLSDETIDKLVKSAPKSSTARKPARKPKGAR